MRKYVRNQMIELLASVTDGLKWAQRAGREGGRELLSDCIAAVDVIGNTLSGNLSAGRYSSYEPKLLGIRDNVERLLDNPSAIRGSKAAGEILKGATQLRYTLLHEPEVLREIAFLPYNVTMWDCLESIWRAAKADPNNYCVVMPLPYYERQDGPPQMLYDGIKFDLEVDVTHFSEYDLALYQPDIIFIHNAYDEFNIITTVHSSYYTGELKKHTNMLVYVPYFVTPDRVSEDMARLPSYQNVDKIIVQNESVRNQFLKYWPEAKIVAMGSPKYDKIIYSDTHKPAIPEQWRRIIRGRKVVLYNTTIGTCLAFAETYMKKLAYIFESFAQSDELVLLWRPHPLMKENLRTILPEIYDEYLALERMYIERKIGIYDDTPDMHMAMAVSEVYFGDFSSLIPLYGITGKPIILQNPYILSNPVQGHEGWVNFLAAAPDKNGKLWFVSDNINGLFCADMESGKTELISRLPEAPDFEYNINSSIFWVGDKLIMAPYNYHSFMERVPCGEIECVKLDGKYRIDAQGRYFFYGGIEHNGSLWLIPDYYEAIVEYNSETGEYICHSEWKEQLEARVDGGSLLGRVFASSCCVRNDSLLLPFVNANIVVEYNTISNKTTLHDIGEVRTGFSCIAYDGEHYWLCPYGEGPITRWNYDTGEAALFHGYPEGFGFHIGTECARAFNYAERVGDAMLLFPRSVNMALRVDIHTGKISEYPGLPSSAAFPAYSLPFRMGSKICALNRESGEIYNIDIETEKVEKLSCVLSGETYAGLFNPNEHMRLASGESGWYLNEMSATNGIIDFIERMVRSVHLPDAELAAVYRARVLNGDGSSGEKIYKYILSCLN